MRKVAQLRLDGDLVCGYPGATYRLYDYKEPAMISTLRVSFIPGQLEYFFERSPCARASLGPARTLWRAHAH